MSRQRSLKPRSHFMQPPSYLLVAVAAGWVAVNPGFGRAEEPPSRPGQEPAAMNAAEASRRANPAGATIVAPQPQPGPLASISSTGKPVGRVPTETALGVNQPGPVSSQPLKPVEEGRALVTAERPVARRTVTPALGWSAIGSRRLAPAILGGPAARNPSTLAIINGTTWKRKP